MKIATLVSNPGEPQMWKYERNDGDFYVQQIVVDSEGNFDSLVKTPQGKFYCFPADINMDVVHLIRLIETGSSLAEKYIENERDCFYD